MAERPQVTFDVTRDWCARHLEPYRAAWPAGIGVASGSLFDAATRHPDVLAACGYQAPAGGRGESAADVTLLQQAIIDRGPVCCLIDAGELERIYATTVPTAPQPGDVRHITAEQLTDTEVFTAVAFATPLRALCGNSRPLVPGVRDLGVCDDCARIANAQGLPPATHFGDQP